MAKMSNSAPAVPTHVGAAIPMQLPSCATGHPALALVRGEILASHDIATTSAWSHGCADRSIRASRMHGALHLVITVMDVRCCCAGRGQPDGPGCRAQAQGGLHQVTRGRRWIRAAERFHQPSLWVAVALRSCWQQALLRRQRAAAGSSDHATGCSKCKRSTAGCSMIESATAGVSAVNSGGYEHERSRCWLTTTW